MGNDLSADPKHASLLAELRADLAKFNEGMFEPDRGEASMSACWEAMRVGGFYGPYVDSADFYSPIQKTPKQMADDVTDKADLDFVEQVLLPNRTKQIEWFQEQVGDLTRRSIRQRPPKTRQNMRSISQRPPKS